jgi:hypothetical protein
MILVIAYGIMKITKSLGVEISYWGHFVMAISTLLRCYVMDIVTNIESPKCCFM